MTEKEVVQALGADFKVYEHEELQYLMQRLGDYQPKIEFVGAKKAFVYLLGIDRLGIVLFSDSDEVIQRVSVRT